MSYGTTLAHGKRRTEPSPRFRDAFPVNSRELLMLAILLVAGACGSTDPSGTVDMSGAGIIHGRVTTLSGEAVSAGDAVIHVLHHPNGCGQPPLESPKASTKADGTYRIPLYVTDFPTGASCFHISVEPSSRWKVPAPKIFDIESLDLQFRSGPPYDSVRVDLTLEPAESWS